MINAQTVAHHAESSMPEDAIDLLEADHAAVNQLFDAFDKSRSNATKKALVADICQSLSVHAQIEEEIFYPELQSVLNDKLSVPDAAKEHAGVKQLMGELQGVEPHGNSYDAKVRLLGDRVKQHVNEEEGDLFPMATAQPLDLIELGARMAARKDDLLRHAA